MAESTHDRNVRLKREHRDQAERLLFEAESAVQMSEAVAHATLALFYQREVLP